jgi:predicted DNA binding protein
MSEADYIAGEIMFEKAMIHSSIDTYISQTSFKQLLLDTQKALKHVIEHSYYLDKEDNERLERVQSIYLKGIGYQRLTDKQKTVLGRFIHESHPDVVIG